MAIAENFTCFSHFVSGIKNTFGCFEALQCKKTLFFRYTLNYVFGGYFIHQLTTSCRAGGFQNLGPLKEGCEANQ
jgi:hypothetical protein